MDGFEGPLTVDLTPLACGVAASEVPALIRLLILITVSFEGAAHLQFMCMYPVIPNTNWSTTVETKPGQADRDSPPQHPMRSGNIEPGSGENKSIFKQRFNPAPFAL